MKTITADTTVGELVRAAPSRSRIFGNLGIDYCCGGKKPLTEICRTKHLDPATDIGSSPKAFDFDVIQLSRALSRWENEGGARENTINEYNL